MTELPNQRYFKTQAYSHLAEIGKALSSPARLEILDLLAHTPRSVESIAQQIDQSVANTSHHLQVLKRAQLVTHKRDGTQIIYSLSGNDINALMSHLQQVGANHLARLEQLKREYFDARDGLEAIDKQTLMKRLQAQDIILLDVRPEDEYIAGHLPGAISLPAHLLESKLNEIPQKHLIVAYCRGPFCALSADVVRRLRELGYDARRTDISVADF